MYMHVSIINQTFSGEAQIVRCLSL